MLNVTPRADEDVLAWAEKQGRIDRVSGVKYLKASLLDSWRALLALIEGLEPKDKQALIAAWERGWDGVEDTSEGMGHE